MSWLETELREQPDGLARLFERRAIRYLLIASRGTPRTSLATRSNLLGRAHRVPVMFATPSLYKIYCQPPRLDGGLVIRISQSGASPDVVAVLAEAREQGRPTLALTNDVDSPLARTAEAVPPLEAGREHAVAATSGPARPCVEEVVPPLRARSAARGRVGRARRPASRPDEARACSRPSRSG